jgi:hypothetical protein
LYFGIKDEGPINEPVETELTSEELIELAQELAENTELQEETTQLLVNPVEFVAGSSAFGGGGMSVPVGPKKTTGVYELEFRIYNYIKKGRVDNIKKFTYYYLLGYFRKSGAKEHYTFSIDILEKSRVSKKSNLLEKIKVKEAMLHNLIKCKKDYVKKIQRNFENI